MRIIMGQYFYRQTNLGDLKIISYTAVTMEFLRNSLRPRRRQSNVTVVTTKARQRVGDGVNPTVLKSRTAASYCSVHSALPVFTDTTENRPNEIPQMNHPAED